MVVNCQFRGHVAIGGASDLNWSIVGTGDFNGDSRPDILWRNTANGANVVWYMNGATYAGSGVVGGVVDQNWKVAGVGDFNGDLRPDILWRNTATGVNLVWFLNGVTRTGGDRTPRRSRSVGNCKLTEPTMIYSLL